MGSKYNAKTWRRIAKNVLLSAAIILGLGGILIFFTLRGVPDPTRLADRNVVQSTKIYDRTRKVVLYDIHGEEKRTVIPLDTVPQNLKNATIAIEDSGFYSHGGIDLRGILRAFFVDVTSGGVKQGGSTITQQLVTNSLLKRNGKSFIRKIREAVIAVIIEFRFSKDEILGFYLNQIPYGSNAYGVEAAAETYFGKGAENLDLAESALLASLPKGPSYYSPYGSHRDELLKRKDAVLDRMAKLGFISETDAANAKRESLNLKRQRQGILAPHFVAYIKEYLAETYGESFVEQGGLRVITTLDWDLEQKAEEIVRDGALRNEKLIDARNSALVAMDPRSGEILSMVGSRDFFADPEPKGCAPGVNCQFDPQVNVAIKARQPGSSFKPFVYATAFDKGYTPDTVLFDVPTEFNTSCNADGSAPPGGDPKNCYSPGNYDEKFRGPVTVRQALAQSLNVPSVELLYLAGVADSIQTANRLGITTIQYDPSRYGLALVLGGAEVTLLDMVHSYGAFAREGQQVPMTGILRVEDAEGNILEEKRDTEPSNVLNPEVARTINDILSDNDARQPIFAPHSSLYFADRQVAAKTGTTQDYRDAWTIGYTPSLVVGVWSGNNDNRPMKQKGSGVLASAPIMHAFLEAALQNSPPEQFTKPLPQNVTKPILRGLWQGGRIVVIDKISKKLATDDTPEDLREEIAAGEPHTILYWVDKNNPRGPIPQNLANDPQYSHWEAALQAWLGKNPVSPLRTPTEADTLHTKANQPRLFVASPTPGDTLKQGDALSLHLSFETTFPPRELDVVINDETKKIISQPSSPTEVALDTSGWVSGDLLLKIQLTDAVGNKAESVIPLLVTQ